MSTPNMAQTSAQRPPFPNQPPPPRAFSPPFPSPGGFATSPPGFAQPPPAKRQRMSPTPYGSPGIASASLPGALSPNNTLTNGALSPPAPAGSMGPPSRPAEKATDIRTIEDSLAGTGVNIDDEERALTAFGSFPHSQASTSVQSSFGTNQGSFDGPPGAGRNGLGDGRPIQNGISPTPDIQTAEEAVKLEIDKANYMAGARRQYELNDPFLFGDAVERRLNQRAYENGIKSPKDGLFHARKDPNKPLQKMRVEAPDGTIRVIDQGQTILSTESGLTLSNLMDLISLATKTRIQGILDLAARLGKERKEYANGRIPEEWVDIAQPPERAASPAAAPSMKRSFSEANGEMDSPKTQPSNPVVNIFKKIADSDRAKEEARLNKRLKRSATINGVELSTAASTPGPATPTPEPEKKITKKDMKVAEAKFTEAQQHKHANETAALATRNLMGGSGLFGKKKQYSWMTGGGGPAKPAATPVVTSAAKITSALSDNVPTSVTSTPTRPAITVPKGKQFGEWDDSKEDGSAIQVRDILTILESDDRAWKALQQGYNKPEMRE